MWLHEICIVIWITPPSSADALSSLTHIDHGLVLIALNRYSDHKDISFGGLSSKAPHRRQTGTMSLWLLVWENQRGGQQKKKWRKHNKRTNGIIYVNVE